MAAIFASEVAAAVAVGIARRPMLGATFVAAGMSTAWAWLRRRQRRADEEVSGKIDAALRLLMAGERTAARKLASAASDVATRGPLHNAALTVLVRVAILEKDSAAAHQALSQMRPASAVDPVWAAAIAQTEGRPRHAIALLEAARERPVFGPAAARLLVELYGEIDDLDLAVQRATTHADLLTIVELENMIASLETWDARTHAAAMRGVLRARVFRAIDTRFPVGVAEDGS